MMDGRWQVGEVHLSKAVEFEGPLPCGGEGSMIPNAYPDDVIGQMPWLVPEWSTADGSLYLAVQAVLVETPTLRLVVDTCAGNGKQRTSPLFNMLDTKFMATFEEASGWSVEDVDAVVCTHLHVDHVGWNTILVDGRWVPAFPNACYYIGRTEYEHWSQSLDEGDARELFSDSIQPLFDADLVTLVASDEQLCSEIALLPTPGHTPGHTSVSIESEGQCALITGDLMHHPCQVGRPDWHSDFDTDSEQGTATRRSILESVADTGTIIIGTHFGGPTAGLVERVEDGYQFSPVRPTERT